MSSLSTELGNEGYQALAFMEARLTQAQKELLLEAVRITGLTLTDFVISSVTDVAKSIVQEREVMHLNPQDSAFFAEALLNQPEPSEKLRASVLRYQQLLDKKGE